MLFQGHGNECSIAPVPKSKESHNLSSDLPLPLHFLKTRLIYDLNLPS